jgi:CheY-like chemotaxis protein
VLVVEDDEDTREVLAELIEAMGYLALRAGTAAEALKVTEESDYDLALIDLGLPGMDGCETARCIRAKVPASVRLVALTGYSDERSRQQAIAAGFDEFLVKPALPEQLEALFEGRRLR